MHLKRPGIWKNYQKMKKETTKEEKIDYRLKKKKSFVVKKKEAMSVIKVKANS